MKTQYKIFVVAVWMLSLLCANTSSQVISCVNIMNNLIKVDSFRAKIDYTNCVSLHRDKQIYYLVTRIKPAGELVPNRCSKVVLSLDGNKLVLSEWTATASILPLSAYDCMMIMKTECDGLQHCKTIWMLNKNTPPSNSSQSTKEALCDLTNLIGNITSSVSFRGVNICDAAISIENSSMFIKSCEPRSVLVPTPNGRYDCLLSVRENGIVENFLVKVNNQFQFVRYNLTNNVLVLSRCPQATRCPSKEDEWTRNGLVIFKKRLTFNLNTDESLFIINITSKQPPSDFLIDTSGNSTIKNTTQLPTNLTTASINSTRPPNSSNSTANQTASQQTTASAPTLNCKPMYRLDSKTKQCVVNVERLLPALIISALIVLAVSILLLLVNFCRSENSAQVHKSVSKLYLAMNSKEEI